VEANSSRKGEKVKNHLSVAHRSAWIAKYWGGNEASARNRETPRNGGAGGLGGIWGPDEQEGSITSREFADWSTSSFSRRERPGHLIDDR